MEPQSTRKVTDAIKGKKAYVTRALDVLVDEGFVKREAGPRGSHLHNSARPFREADDSGPPPTVDDGELL